MLNKLKAFILYKFKIQSEKSIRDEELELDAFWDKHIKSDSDLKQENSQLRSALSFYANRPVYEKLSQFKGDSELSECSDIAEEALKIK